MCYRCRAQSDVIAIKEPHNFRSLPSGKSLHTLWAFLCLTRYHELASEESAVWSTDWKILGKGVEEGTGTWRAQVSRTTGERLSSSKLRASPERVHAYLVSRARGHPSSLNCTVCLQSPIPYDNSHNVANQGWSQPFKTTAELSPLDVDRVLVEEQICHCVVGCKGGAFILATGNMGLQEIVLQHQNEKHEIGNPDPDFPLIGLYAFSK